MAYKNIEDKRKYDKNYYQTNKDKILEQGRIYRQNNKDIILKREREKYKKYYINNKEKISKRVKEYQINNKEIIKEHRKKYREANKEKIRKQVKLYCLKNKEEIKEYLIQNKDKINKWHRQWRIKNYKKFREYMNNWQKNKCKTDLKYNFNRRISCLIRQSVKDNKNGKHWEYLTGYTCKDLIKHLKTTMPEGYTWQDFLKNNKLHIDHIIPISAFNFTKPEHPDFRRCWALENLQLLLAKENLRKSNKLYEPFQLAKIIK